MIGAAVALAHTAAANPDLPARSLLLDACRVGQAVVAVGERGYVVRSEDSGRSWTPGSTPTLATLTGVTFSDPAHGWAVGHGGTVLRSDDAGFTWAASSKGVPADVALLDVYALDLRHVVAAGAFGAFFVSTDGRTWMAQKVLEQDLHLNRITSAGGETLFIAGEQGTLLRLPSLRDKPAPVETGYEGSFNGVLLLRDGTLLAYGLRGHVYHAQSAEGPWVTAQNLPPVLISTAVQLKSGTIVLAGQARVFLVSRDGGKSFQAWNTPLTTAVAELLEAPDGSVLAFGEAGATRMGSPDPEPETPKPAP